MKRLLIFKVEESIEEPIDKHCRPWLKGLKKTIGIDQSIVKYINYKYGDIVKADYKNPYSVDLEKYDAIYQGTEFWSLSHILRIKGKRELEQYTNLLSKKTLNKRFVQPYEYIKFGFNKCEVYKQLMKIGIKMAPTKCISTVTKSSYPRVKKYQLEHGRLFMKPIPGEATTNVYNTKGNIIKKSEFNEYMKKLQHYNQLVIQKYMPQFATDRYPEIRTYWIGNKFHYAIHTTTAGYYQKTTYKIPKVIREDTLKIIKHVEKKFKFKFTFARFDWGYDENMGYFLNEIELFPGTFSNEMNDDKGKCVWNIDEKIGDRLVELITV